MATGDGSVTTTGLLVTGSDVGLTDASVGEVSKDGATGTGRVTVPTW